MEIYGKAKMNERLLSNICLTLYLPACSANQARQSCQTPPLLAHFVRYECS